MLPLLLSRTARAFLLLFLLSLLVFALSRKMPGDIWTSLEMDPSVSPETLRQLRSAYDLDRPLPVQYARWLRLLLHGNLGYSPLEKRAVGPLLRERLASTIVLSSVTMGLTVAASLLLSLLTLKRKWDQRWLDSGIIPLLLAIPTTLTCLLLNWVRIHSGTFSFRDSAGGGSDFAAVIWPSLALSIPVTAYLARQVRREMTQILNSQYVAMAESKGLSILYLFRHVVRPAAPVFLNLAGVLFTSLIGGAIVAETVFDFPGIGLLTWEAVLNRDIFLLISSVLAGCTLVIIVNLAVDLLALWADPRLRIETSL